MNLMLPWPPSVNGYWLRSPRGMYLSKRGREYREDALKQFLTYEYSMITGRCSLHITAFPPDRRKRDLDNILKPTLDLLEHAKVVEDDNQFDQVTIVRGEIIKFGELWIHIEPSKGIARCAPRN